MDHLTILFGLVGVLGFIVGVLVSIVFDTKEKINWLEQRLEEIDFKNDFFPTHYNCRSVLMPIKAKKRTSKKVKNERHKKIR